MLLVLGLVRPTEPEGVFSCYFGVDASAVVADAELISAELDANPKPLVVAAGPNAARSIDRVVNEVLQRRNESDVLHEHRDEKLFGWKGVYDRFGVRRLLLLRFLSGHRRSC